jgi:AcrR family transcriptional regulator
MSTAAPPPEPFRAKVQQMLHDTVLDVARRRLLETDWSEVRLVDVADEVGVSRQTIYNMFGTKDQLGEALFMREGLRYLDGALSRLDQAESLEAAIRSTLAWALDEARANQTLVRALEMARQGEADAVLPYLTVYVDVLLSPLRDSLVQASAERWPELDPTQLGLGLEAGLRLIVSLLMSSSSQGDESMFEVVVALAGGALVVPPPPG